MTHEAKDNVADYDADDGVAEDRNEISVSIRHLKLFESVARLSSVRKASEECHLSQPAVTQAIAKLEEQLGVALLERRASGSYLNEYGVIFHRRTQRLFRQVEDALVALGVPNNRMPVALLSSRITRSQIRSLIAIVENGSFAQAARALGVSQTSLHRAARDLERALALPLYVQTSSGVMATPGGAEFARKVKLAMSEIDRGVDELEAAKGNFGGEIVVGAMLLAGSVVLASVLNEFVAAYPNANVRVLNGNAEDMLKYLRAGDVDFVIGLLRAQAQEGLVHEVFAETPYVVVGRRGHPLLKKAGPLTLDDLAGYDWVVGTPGSNRRDTFESLFEGRRKPPARIATCSLPTIRTLLQDSDRLTLLTSYEMIQEDEGLAGLPFEGFRRVPAIGLTMREDWLPTEIQANFLELIQKRIVGSLVLRRELKMAG
jgi:DNA-binding transcriptional LysR family regulator